MLEHERRRIHRVTLRQPIRAFAGAVAVQLVDASIAGVRVIHSNPLPAAGSAGRGMCQSDVGRVSVYCEVVSTGPHPGGQQTGLRVLAADRQSQERLRKMVTMLS